MLKLRLKRNGRKKSPCYRIVIIESQSKRNGRFVDEVGFYDPIKKLFSINIPKTRVWLKNGVIPSSTVMSLLDKVNY